MFADTWSDTMPFELKFKFGKSVQLSELSLFWQGELPDFTIKIPGCKDILSKGGKKTQVLLKKVALPDKKANVLTIAFAKRKNGGKLTISELEIWGK